MSISEHNHMPESARRIEVFTGAGPCLEAAERLRYR
jgi:hypothetical protein